MRFVIAIVTFVVAAILIGVGFGQRTIWAPPQSISAQASVPSGTRYIVIGGTSLNAIEGQQTLQVSGGSAAPFVAYGRTDDVTAWLGDQSYVRLTYQNGGLVSKTVKAGSSAGLSSGSSSSTPTPHASSTPTTSATEPAGSGASQAGGETRHPDPNGSDLWLQQFTGSSAALTRMNVPDSVSVIIASNGTDPAPSRVRLTWPLSGDTPWAGPLIVLGGALLLTGLILYVFALRGMRRSRGPRRGRRPPRLPRAPRSRRIKTVVAPRPGTRGRRAIGRSMVAAPLVLVGALALSGCSSEYWPAIGQHPSPTPTATPLATELPGQADNPAPAVTSAQLDQIIARVSQTATQADTKGDAKLIATRFTGAALAERVANYAVRAKVPGYPAPKPISSNAPEIALPQATAAWPRAVTAVVSDPKTPKAAPIDLVLVQQTPREQYKVAYAITLEAGAKLPRLNPIAIGAVLDPPESKLLKIAPSALAGAYASVLKDGEKSPSYKLFDTKVDALAPQIGAAYKADQISKVASGKTSTLSFTDTAGSSEPIALASYDSGAIVATSVDETAAQRVTEAGATVTVDNPNGPTAALTGKTSNSTGFQTDYSYQLLFYVPPAESDAKIQLLGFTQAVVGAKELQ